MARSSEYKRRRKLLLALLRQIRVECGLRQVDIAKLMRKPQSFVSNYESGERRLDLLELHQLCDAVGLPLVEFVQRFDQAVREPKESAREARTLKQ
jgi:transcriptional regulator with XRE-family HTH domain